MTDVSVIIATRHRPVLLERAIRSVLAQRFDGRIEVVVVVDGAGMAPLEHLAGPRVRLVPNERTPGLAGARNTGLAHARSEVIAFCDDDDEWLSDKLSYQLHLLAGEPRSSIIATGIRIVSAGGDHDRNPPAVLGLEDFLASRHTEVHPSSFLFRRELLEAIGGVDEELPGSYGEDYDLLLRAAAHGRVHSVQQPLTIVHWDRTSFFADRWTNIAEALRYLLAKFPEFEASPRGRSRVEGQIAFAYASLNDRRAALHWARASLRHDWRRKQAWAALAITGGLVSGGTVLRLANRAGKGI